jgi:hypothetical protein
MSAGGLCLYIIGQPGAGKSTLMAAFTDAVFDRQEPVTEPVAHRRLWHLDLEPGRKGLPDAIELGRRRIAFSGTDALSYSAGPKVAAFLRERPARLVLGEGDRLAHRSFFAAVTTAGYDLCVIHLDTGDYLAAEYRRQRGSTQAESWLKGRQTKVKRLAEEFATVRLDGGAPLDGLILQMVDAVRSRQHATLGSTAG